jgi:hypothetical protein
MVTKRSMLQVQDRIESAIERLRRYRKGCEIIEDIIETDLVRARDEVEYAATMAAD